MNTMGATRNAYFKPTKGGLASIFLVFITLVFASSLAPNEYSYLFVLPIALIALSFSTASFSGYRRTVIAIALLLLLLGTTKGYFEGHAIEFMLKFVAPLTVFIVFCCVPGIGLAIFNARRTFFLLGFAFTCVVFVLLKTRVDLASLYLKGWTVTESSEAGVSVWHYFALPIIFSAVQEHRNKGVKIAYALIAVLWIGLLVFMTDTSAFWLAALFSAACVLSGKRMSKVLAALGLVFITAIVVDFYTIKAVCGPIVDYLYSTLAVYDEGDYARVTQLEYFVVNSEFFGAGFGAAHNFPLGSSEYRKMAQLTLPYASELAILNWMYNGGIFAGIWLYSVGYAFLRLFLLKHENDQQSALRAFGLACSGVLVGSLSNPFLFSPVAMFTLAIMIDISDQTSRRKVTVGQPQPHLAGYNSSRTTLHLRAN